MKRKTVDELTAMLKARELVNKVAPADIRVSVEAYAKEVCATIRVEYDLKPDESGYCVPGKGKYRIVTNGNEDETRQRFTVCHEIAHIVLGLPSEHTSMPSWSYAKRSPNEILCDVFASELLLPYKLFKPLVDKADISLAAIDDLAERACASSMATGSRFAALVRAPCAFVLSEQGKVRYASRSTMLRQANAWIPPRTILPQDSLSHRLRGDGTANGPEEIEADVWFENWARGGTLLEDARHLSQWDQTIALLWFEDEEVPAPVQDRHKREEEEFGLAELDGVLPWPGKKRRK
jgi:IrrE N-terminal-like domain